MIDILIQLTAMRDEMREANLDYYAEHIDYIIKLSEHKLLGHERKDLLSQHNQHLQMEAR